MEDNYESSKFIHVLGPILRALTSILRLEDSKYRSSTAERGGEGKICYGGFMERGRAREDGSNGLKVR